MDREEYEKELEFLYAEAKKNEDFRLAFDILRHRQADRSGAGPRPQRTKIR